MKIELIALYEYYFNNKKIPKIENFNLGYCPIYERAIINLFFTGQTLKAGEIDLTKYLDYKSEDI